MLTIRRVQPQDIFSVIKIAHESLPERYQPNIFNTFYESFPQGFLIALKHHKIVGFLIGVKTHDSIAKILMLSVNENHRKQGIGSALLINFLQEMLLQNIHLVNLEVRTNNKIAITFYKKHGFDIQETITGFYQNVEDAYSMRQVLQMH
ncbi:MAG: GNAT family N-acetyltransferase [Candidatus Thermoplasmatota archaeon]|nr:GNAT family N-acetyltransferase [Candidatus Thermoplasmatota archaeon]